MCKLFGAFLLQNDYPDIASTCKVGDLVPQPSAFSDGHPRMPSSSPRPRRHYRSVETTPTTAEAMIEAPTAKVEAPSKKRLPAWTPWALATLVGAVAISSATLRRLTLSAVYETGRMPLIDCFHAVAVAYEHRRDHDPEQGALQKLVAILITALGGTTIMNLILGQPCGKWRIPIAVADSHRARPLLCPSNAPARSQAYPTESHLLESRLRMAVRQPDDSTVRGRVACLLPRPRGHGLPIVRRIERFARHNGCAGRHLVGCRPHQVGLLQRDQCRPRESARLYGGGSSRRHARRLRGRPHSAGMLTPACRVGLPYARLPSRATPLNGWLWGEGVLLLCEPMLCTP